MSKQSSLGKKTVELRPAARPSRIRREPPPADKGVASLVNKIDWGSREWEVRFAVAGIANVDQRHLRVTPQLDH